MYILYIEYLFIYTQTHVTHTHIYIYIFIGDTACIYIYMCVYMSYGSGHALIQCDVTKLIPFKVIVQMNIPPLLAPLN